MKLEFRYTCTFDIEIHKNIIKIYKKKGITFRLELNRKNEGAKKK